MRNSYSLPDVNEIDRYEAAVAAVIKGRMDPEKFMAFRLQHGIYGQRQDGVHMVRIKVPGGRMNVLQINKIADVLAQYSQHSHAQVTTRQDIQLHYVPLVETPQVMRELAKVGLTTREACGNTVRNITACAMAGICPREHTDVAPFVEGVVQRFLRNPLTQHLPRKFKISISGCEADCAMGNMHDVGVIATKKENRFGFKVVAGGGLGHKPRQAVTIEEFIEEKALLPSIEAVLALHNRYSDRKKRAKARLKFLVDKFGKQEFVEKYREEFRRTQAAFADEQYPTGKWQVATSGEGCGTGSPRHVMPQKQAGKVVLPINLPVGDVSVAQLRGLAQVMSKENLPELRTTIDQNFLLVNVPEARIAEVRAALTAFGLQEPKVGDNIVSCPGTTTCRLGITSSKLIASQLSGGSADLRIRASGCHNSCGQHHVGDIGIHGEGKRLHGKLIPHYVMHFGGDGAANGAFAMEGPEIPAARITLAISRVQETFLQDRGAQENFFTWSRRRGIEFFHNLLSDLAAVSPDDIPHVARDYGDAETFQVLQLGGGECAGAAQDKVASNFSEAMYERHYRNAFALQRKYAAAVGCSEQIVRLVGNSLLFLAGIKPLDELAQIASSLALTMPKNQQQLHSELMNMISVFEQLKENFDLDVFNAACQRQDKWIKDAASVCQSLDQQLDLMTSLATLKDGQSSTSVLVDLSSYQCPLHYIKAKNELRKRRAGELIDFLLEPGKAVQQVSTSLANDGHFILAVEEQPTGTVIKVRKGEKSLAL